MLHRKVVISPPISFSCLVALLGHNNMYDRACTIYKKLWEKNLKFKNISLFRIKQKMFFFWLKNLRSYPNKTVVTGNSDLMIDVVIPTIEKDLDVLPYSIAGVKKNIRHPIGALYIVAPKSEKIMKFCLQENCTFIDESSLLSINQSDIQYDVNGLNRSSWIYQQFLKWSGSKFCKNTNYLIVDSDTVYVRPQVFEYNGKTVFNCSDEYHKPYFDVYERLLGEQTKFPFSFTSHQMLFNIDILNELKDKIEFHTKMKWYLGILENIDKRKVSSHSDYETYGQYYYSHYRRKMIIEYWYNLSRPRVELADYDFTSSDFPFKSISFHSWNR